jgi:hypothetical protein
MERPSVVVVGGGIGGLFAANIARRKTHQLCRVRAGG